MPEVRVYETTNHFTTHRWLCAAHLKARRASGWTCKHLKAPTEGTLTCDDCRIAKHGAANVPCSQFNSPTEPSTTQGDP